MLVLDEADEMLNKGEIHQNRDQEESLIQTGPGPDPEEDSVKFLFLSRF